MQYFVYLLICSDGSFYTGYTNNLKSRVNTHNTGKGAKYTANRRPVCLVYSEAHSSKQSALKREAQIKGWTRKKKQTLIAKK